MCLAGDVGNRDLLMFDKLRAAVGSTIDRAYARALDVLGRNQRALDALAAALFTAGYLDRAEIEAVLTKTPLRSRAIDDVSAQEHSQHNDTAHDEIVVDVAGTPTLISTEITTL